RAAGNELDDLRVVRDVRKTEARLAVRHDVEQVEAAARRHVARLDQPADGRGTGLRIRAHGFLLERRQATLGVAGREAAVTHDAVVVGRLLDAGLDLAAEPGRDRARRHDALAADELA